MSWSEMPELPKSNASADASARIVKRGARTICNITLRKAIATAAGFKDKTPIQALQGFAEHQGRIRLCADPQGPYRCREYRGGSMALSLVLPKGCGEAACKALPVPAALVGKKPSVVEVVLPADWFHTPAPAAPPNPRPRGPAARQNADADLIHTSRGPGDPEIGGPATNAGTVALPGRKWNPGGAPRKG